MSKGKASGKAGEVSKLDARAYARTLNDGPAEAVPIASGRIKTHPKNPRRGDLEAIKASIGVNGFYGALTANRRTGHILAGNHRYLAARELGFDAVPVVWVDVGKAEEERILAADNRTSDLGVYDNTALASLLEGLAAEAGGLEGTGYGDEDLGALLDELAIEPLDEGDGAAGGGADESRAEALAQKWGTAQGQIWSVGAHRLMCGDSTSAADMDALLGGVPVDLLLTDPPYGVSYADKNRFLNAVGRGNHIQEPIINDHMSVEDTGKLWLSVFGLCAARMKEGACYYMTGPQGGDLSLMMMMMIQKSGLLLKHILVWVKNNHVLERTDYNYKHEPILYGWKEGAGHYFGGEASETSVWEYDKPHAAKLHPTMKPVELFERAVKNGSRRGEAVLDPFMGSGTTAIACERLGRRAFGMELSPAYLAVQLERLSELGLSPMLNP